MHRTSAEAAIPGHTNGTWREEGAIAVSGEDMCIHDALSETGTIGLVDLHSLFFVDTDTIEVTMLSHAQELTIRLPASTTTLQSVEVERQSSVRNIAIGGL